MKCEWFQLALNRSSICFHWLTRLSDTLLAWCWSQVGSLLNPAAVAKCLACVSSASLSQASVKSAQVLLPFQPLCSLPAMFVCVVCRDRGAHTPLVQKQ